jgi:hypothetical protein
MALRTLTKGSAVTKKSVASLIEATQFKGTYLEFHEQFDVILYDRKEGTYYKLLKLSVKPARHDAPIEEVLDFEADFSNEAFVVYKGSDSE